MTWYKDGLQFECTQCGRCCTGEPGYVWLTDANIEQIAERLDYSVFQFTTKFVHTVPGLGKSLVECGNGDCVLLNDKTRGCRVYEDRPIQCKTWPFWDRNIDSPESWKKTAKFCKGCNRGRLYTFEEIEDAKVKFPSMGYIEE